MHGANDAGGYFVSGGLRRRGYLQGHRHLGAAATSGSGGSLGLPLAVAGSSGLATYGPGGTYNSASVLNVAEDTNGAVRSSNETHGPALTVHLYMHLGRLI